MFHVRVSGCVCVCVYLGTTERDELEERALLVKRHTHKDRLQKRFKFKEETPTMVVNERSDEQTNMGKQREKVTMPFALPAVARSKAGNVEFEQRTFSKLLFIDGLL